MSAGSGCVDPTPVSWAKMWCEVLTDVRQLQALLEHHQNAGLGTRS